ncbi:MAG TPA: 3-hydroxyacyl-CoA dehydrogenase NAD-binding domain-containing protein [Chitinophagaceae bacterium]|nr:3-hydroxybutyryl-CoA dehydrogenase [Chitinophagales bacterium]HPG09921.1 3-hydroxyacyl-CoA dehydrogenase NAD-binding domain-containing protein [Chitinophagaceae bacterium]
MEVQKICVCGSGTMGSGIAQAAAQAGIQSILYDLNPSILDKARAATEKNLARLVEKTKITDQEKNAIQERITYTSSIEDCKAEICIEAIIEKSEAKTDLFQKLAAINNSDTLFASNTSSLSLNAIAKKIPAPERFAGMHFFNPATIMKLVEVIKTSFSSDETIQKIASLAKQIGKTPVICKDSPGFIVNRVARPFYIEAFRIAEEQNNFSQIDTLLESAGFKMGPFRLMDLIGNDVNYAVSCSVYEQMNNPERLKPSWIQKEKVEKGELGRKSGKGYYTYAS